MSAGYAESTIARFKLELDERVPEAMLGCREPVCLGIDEAGRGCVLGPLVYGMVVWRVKDSPRSSELGMRDSKTMTALARERCRRACFAQDWLATATLRVQADSLSKAMREGTNLNVLSHSMIGVLIERACARFQVEAVFCDTVGTSESMAKRLQIHAPEAKIHVSAKADSLFPIVSAASVIAKVARDEAIDVIAAVCAELGAPSPGSGYSSDATTVAWLKHVLKKQEWRSVLLREIRTEWSTVARIEA